MLLIIQTKRALITDHYSDDNVHMLHHLRKIPLNYL